MSYLDETTINLVASKKRDHFRRLTVVEEQKLKVLPIAVIYGGNASGKTNLVKAISFLKQLITKGPSMDENIPNQPFLLSSARKLVPTTFKISVLIDDIIYDLLIELNNKRILRESLCEIKKRKSKLLYDRRFGDSEPDNNLDTFKEISYQFAYKGTRENQLFLSNSVSQGLDKFKKLWDWFKNSLIVISPDSKYKNKSRFFAEDDPYGNRFNELFQKLDTGVQKLVGEPVNMNSIDLPREIIAEIESNLTESSKTVTLQSPDECFQFTAEKTGEIKAKKLFTYHSDEFGNEVKFDLRSESDGTKRLFDLFPAFIKLSDPKNKSTIIIDEIDRSLHTLMTRKIISLYLESCKETSRTQLITTTHDLMLIDRNILRLDEMWLAERDKYGRTFLSAMSDFEEANNDKNLCLSYLQGRMGGIPQLVLNSFHPENHEQDTSPKKESGNE